MESWNTDDRQQNLITGPNRRYQYTRFERHEDVPLSNCFVTDPPSRWFWKMRIAQTTIAKFYLINGEGLIAASNNPAVIPNSEATFTGKTGQQAKRTVTIYGLQPGTTLIEFRRPGSNDTVVTMQVEVFGLPGKKPSWVKFGAKAGVFLGGHLANRYFLDWMRYRPSGPPETLFDSVPAGTKHIVVNAHGQMNTKDGSLPVVPGITVYIAGNLWRGNCFDVFAKLRAAGVGGGGGIIWFAGCEVGADEEFCEKAVKASGCFVVAPAITLPIVGNVPRGMIDWFGESMPKAFNKESGKSMDLGAFLARQETLQFQVVPG